MKPHRPVSSLLLSLVLTLAMLPGSASAGGRQADGYDRLVQLFHDWRQFARPAVVDGVPDYSAEAMAAQRQGLAEYQQRLAAIDTSDWPVPRRIDWHLLRAEMNGLELDHRVRRPWANDPAFYVMIFPAQSDVPAHEGPVIDGWIDLWKYDYPLSRADAAELASRIGVIPPLLQRARVNLVGEGHDLWRMGIEAMRGQSADLAALAAEVTGTSADLDRSIDDAIAASDGFAAWLESELPHRNGPSGIGKEAYTWALRNVHYLPYDWDQAVTLMRRELWRAHAALRLEENRNRDLPRLTRYGSPEEYDAALNAAVTEYMDFLRREEILTIRPYMEAALRERIGSYSPPTRPDGLRGFFAEADYRDGVVMRTHGYHWFDLARMQREPHESPIRRGPLLFNLWDARSEGMATAVEEMMMHAGLFDQKPRSRELIWILAAQRAARALGGLMMHGNEWTMQQAVDFASKWTPRGWMPPDSATVWGEQHLYLRQPVYGVSYLMGKIEIEHLMAEYALQLGDDFSIRRFFDDFNDVGVIPVSLIRWELTGDGEQVAELGGRR